MISPESAHQESLPDPLVLVTSTVQQGFGIKAAPKLTSAPRPVADGTGGNF
jgi:hypothetical protein